MTEFLFKHFQGPQNRGDLVWSHPNRRQIVVIDGVSGANPEKARALCLQWLQQQSANAMLRTELVVRSLDNLLRDNGAQAVFGMATHRQNNTVIVDIVGNLRIYELTPHQPVKSLRERDVSQPEQVLGQNSPLNPHRYQITLSYDTKYVFSSDGLNHAKMLEQLRFEQLEHNVRESLHVVREEDDWSAVIFPVDLSTEQADDESWLEALIGEPSADVAEHAVHKELARQAITSSALQGSRVVRNPFFKGAKSTREVDALFVTPLGLFFIEVKGHADDVELYVDSSDRNSMILHDNRSKPPRKIKDANPVRKGLEAIRNYQNALQSVAPELIPEARKTVVICFTSSHADVTCIDGNGASHNLPYHYGEALICDLKSMVPAIIKHAESWAGKKKKPLLSPAQINNICQRFLIDLDTNEVPQMLAPGLILDESKVIAEESTDYFTVLEASHYGDKVWAKRYKNDSFKRLDSGTSIARIAREVPVLQRLGRHRVPGIPYYYWHYHKGDDLIIFLEPGHPTNLLDWLQTNPSRAERLSAIKKLSHILSLISSFKSPAIVLRSINPKNIRISQQNHSCDTLDLQLINFELTQSDDIKTLPITARTQFDRLYQADEVLDSTAAVSQSADVFSFAMICAFILSGASPNKLKLQQKNEFSGLLSRSNLPPEDAELLTKGVHPNARYRPSMASLNKAIKLWS